MSRVEWVDGPPEVEQIHNERIRELLPELIARPGEWAIVETGRKWHSARQAWVRKGCQASARREADGTYTIYARWPPPRTAYQVEREKRQAVRDGKLARIQQAARQGKI